MSKVVENLQVSLPLQPSSRRNTEPSELQGVPLVFRGSARLIPTAVFDTYWRFAAERQRIFFRRVRQEPGPLTSDPILRAHKFTNAYRASDRVSQYLIRRVIYEGDRSPREMFFRVMLFKLFNRIETWELLTNELDHVRWDEYTFDRYDAVLSRAMANGQRIYSGAYIIPSPRLNHPRKHQNHLRLIERMLADELPERIVDTRSLQDAFRLLRSYPSMGDFLAFQLVTDLNYSPLLEHSESEFVVPGPGARDGIRKCFADTGGLHEADVIRMMVERQDEEFARLDLEFYSLWGRPLQLIDCQNLFCEVDKYARLAHPEVQGISGRTRIKQRYRPTSERIDYWYPPKWGLNDRIASTGAL